MLVGRQFLGRLAMVVVVLFLIAAAFNDHSTTSVDGSNSYEGSAPPGRSPATMRPSTPRSRGSSR